MPAPHVAGVTALYLEASPDATPSAVASAITGAGTTGQLASVGTGSPNLLVYSPLTADDGGTDGGTDEGDSTAPPCSDCMMYSGTLSGSGDYHQQPDGTYYYSPSGTHRGWLRGDAGMDFDLELYKWHKKWGRQRVGERRIHLRRADRIRRREGLLYMDGPLQKRQRRLFLLAFAAVGQA